MELFSPEDYRNKQLTSEGQKRKLKYQVSGPRCMKSFGIISLKEPKVAIYCS